MTNHQENWDAILILRLTKGDENSFIEIYNLYWEKIFLIAYTRIKNKEIAEELVQNIFLKLWERRAALKITHLEHYLSKSIKNAILDHFDSQIVANKYREYWKFFGKVNEETTGQMVAFNEVSLSIEEGISKLPQKTQEVFKLSRLEYWPTEKISSHLNISEKTVQYHLTKSLKFMRSFLKEFIFLLLWFVTDY